VFLPVIPAAAGSAKRFKQLLLQQTGTWDEVAAALLEEFEGEIIHIAPVVGGCSGSGIMWVRKAF